MAVTTTLLQDLWQLADADAGQLGDDVALVVVEAFGGPGSQGRFMPPGERATGEPPDVQRQLDEDAHRSRVVLPVKGLEHDPAAILGLMRHHLEYARIYREAKGTYALDLTVAAALYPVFKDGGKGTGLIYNTIPMMRAANAAAAWLVTQTFGPQLERLRDPDFATLFRPEDPPLEITEMTLRSVVFAAVWAGAVEHEVDRHATSLQSLLAGADTAAPGWWETLLANSTFLELAGSATSHEPLPEEREAFVRYPADAWRPLVDLADRAVRYGTKLL